MKVERAARLKKEDIEGLIYPTTNFGLAEVIEFRKSNDVTVKFLDTGATKVTRLTYLRTGKIKDNSISGEYNKKLYSVWASMKDRCTNKNCHAYGRYGGRGITVCDTWLHPPNFIHWAKANGYSEGLDIDRIDNDKGYSPENCHWVDRRANARNRGNKSKYGPCIYKQSKDGFHVRVYSNGKLHNLGTHTSIKEAEKARDKFTDTLKCGG